MALWVDGRGTTRSQKWRVIQKQRSDGFSVAMSSSTINEIINQIINQMSSLVCIVFTYAGDAAYTVAFFGITHKANILAED